MGSKYSVYWWKPGDIHVPVYSGASFLKAVWSYIQAHRGEKKGNVLYLVDRSFL
ncbi:hypothetical protein CZP2022_53 [Vibrio phage C-ZP2022]|nr:hypothetical protein CZP2022_53 [Vibrio phage C-ZP2022]